MKASPSSVRAALDACGVRPSKRLGQNFLIDANILVRILDAAQAVGEKTVLEVGPGLGQVTSQLLDQGFEVHAVEYDHRLASHLRQHLTQDTFYLTEGDAVDQPLGSLPPGSPFQIVSNLPYAITSPWLEKILLESSTLPSAITLLLQLEAWERLIAPEGSKARGGLAILFTESFTPVWQQRVPPRCFFPIPEVESVLVHAHRKPGGHRFARPTVSIIRQLFQQRRKQIGKRLEKSIGSPPYRQLLNASASRGLSPDSRPEDLSNQVWIALDELLRDLPPDQKT
ncbi:MAG: 16S rRNA (adenine(1518)-N(6)/adenine(1519)-N(6))-dimethyltransferase RsmA [Puniceicoccaceae bacterium]